MECLEPLTFHLIFSYYTLTNSILFRMSMVIHYTTCLKRGGAGCFQIHNSAIFIRKSSCFHKITDKSIHLEALNATMSWLNTGALCCILTIMTIHLILPHGCVALCHHHGCVMCLHACKDIFDLLLEYTVL